jgi:hypothetical protein
MLFHPFHHKGCSIVKPNQLTIKILKFSYNNEIPYHHQPWYDV